MRNIDDRTIGCNCHRRPDLHATVANDMDILLDSRVRAYGKIWFSSMPVTHNFQSSTVTYEDPFPQVDVFRKPDHQGGVDNATATHAPELRPVIKTRFQGPVPMPQGSNLVNR